MQVRLQRAVDKWIGVPLCALLSLLERLRPARAPTLPPQKILVILLSEMGSLVLAYPMFAWLRERYPAASIHMLMFAKNREALELMEVIPRENILTLDDGSAQRFVTDSARMITTLRRHRFDAVIDCELFTRISSIFAYLSNAPVRVGFHPQTQEGLYRGSFINRPVIYNPYRHLTLQLLTMAGAIESATQPRAKFPVLPPRLTAPQVRFENAELQAMRGRFAADFPAAQNRRLVLVYPGGGILPIRAWPAANYQALCKQLIDRGLAVGVIGLAEDKPLARAIVQAAAHDACVDLTGYTKRIRDLLALFQGASLLIANDGAPGQLSALTKMPAIVFFGPETPALYGPIAPHVFCFHRALPCSPCLTAYNHRLSPCDGDNQCLKQIGVDEVMNKALQMLLPAVDHVQ